MLAAWKISSATILLIGIACSTGCEKPEAASTRIPDEPPAAAPEPTIPEPAPTIPADRILSDQSGRQIRATIVGRESDRLHIIRSGDGMKTSIPISMLSSTDQTFAFRLPIQLPPQGFFEPEEKESSLPPESQDPNELFIRNREKEIERLTDENLRLGEESSATTNRITKRTHLSKIRKNEEQIAHHQFEIERVRSHTR